MSEKKKIPPLKTPDKRMNTPQPTKNTKSVATARSAVSSRSAAAAVPETISADKQLRNFESAIRLFHARRYKEARELFLQAAGGPERDVAHRAQLHATMCERRMDQPAVNLRSAEEHYNYAIALLNTRKVDDASSHLERALELEPDSDHVHYALALAHALSGNLTRAHDHLQRAIELDPKNRILARQDTDFAHFSNQPQFQALLYPEKKGW